MFQFSTVISETLVAPDVDDGLLVTRASKFCDFWFPLLEKHGTNRWAWSLAMLQPLALCHHGKVKMNFSNTRGVASNVNIHHRERAWHDLAKTHQGLYGYIHLKYASSTCHSSICMAESSCTSRVSRLSCCVSGLWMLTLAVCAASLLMSSRCLRSLSQSFLNSVLRLYFKQKENACNHTK